MDELLSSLAATYLHTRFVRVVLDRASRLPPELGLPHASGECCRVPHSEKPLLAII